MLKQLMEATILLDISTEYAVLAKSSVFLLDHVSVIAKTMT